MKQFIELIAAHDTVIMVFITAIYVLTTILIWFSNHNSAKAARKAVEESKRQFELNKEQFELSKKQFEQSVELQKQHNYDSVRPAVSIGCVFHDNSDTFSGTITIVNHGLGPAIIKELNFKKDDKEYKNKNGYCTIIDLIRFRIEEENEALTIKDIFRRCNWCTNEFRNAVGNRDFLAVGGKLTLLDFETNNKERGDLVGRVFHGVEMELVYTDIYDSNEWRVTADLSHFKPN